MPIKVLKKMGDIRWIGAFACAMALVGMVAPTGGQVGILRNTDVQ
jgi:hypothetical protein